MLSAALLGKWPEEFRIHSWARSSFFDKLISKVRGRRLLVFLGISKAESGLGVLKGARQWAEMFPRNTQWRRWFLKAFTSNDQMFSWNVSWEELKFDIRELSDFKDSGPSIDQPHLTQHDLSSVIYERSIFHHSLRYFENESKTDGYSEKLFAANNSPQHRL